MKRISFYVFLTISLLCFTANSQTWSSIGPEGGWVDHIAYHPTQHNVMYASGDTHGGIYKSTDGGNTWNNLSGYGCYNAWSFEIHPTRPDTIYAGSMMNEIDSVGLRVSIDGGLTWQTTLKWPSISQIAVHPTNPNIVFAAAGYWPGYQTNTHGEGIWKSIDGGFTWNKIVTGLIDNMSVQSIVINPSNPNAMHVGVWGVFGNGKGMYASLDGGNTWFAAGLANKDVWKVAICSNSANVLYAATQDSVYKSVDYGSTWNKMTIASNVFQGLYFGISISKSNNNVVYVGSLVKGMFKTTDGGTTWSSALNNGLSATRIWEVSCHPTNTNEVFCGQQGTGIWKTTNGATQWQSSNTGFKCTYISDLHYNSSGLYAALYNEAGNNYASVKKWSGANWSSIGLNDTWVGKMTSVPNATNILFATKTDAGFFASPSNRLMRSNNAGSNWYHTGVGIDTTVEIKVIKIDLSNSNTMYAGNAKGFYKSIDGGNTFTLTGLNNLNVTSIVVSSTSSNVIYAGTWSGVYTSTNSGLNWTALPTFSIPIFCLAQLPSSPQTLLAGTYGAGILKSTDAGASWNNVATNLLGKVIQCLLVDPSNSNTIYAGGEMGVYVSTNQGNTGTWTDFSSGMNTYKSKIMNLEVDMSTGNLYAGTLGYGAFSRNIFNTTLVKKQVNQKTFAVYPIPTNNYLLIDTKDVVKSAFQIINMQGIVIEEHDLSDKINVSHLPNGLYFIKPKDQSIPAQKFIKN